MGHQSRYRLLGRRARHGLEVGFQVSNGSEASCTTFKFLRPCRKFAIKLSFVTPSDIVRDAIHHGVFPGATAYLARGETVTFAEAQGQLGVAPPFDKPVTPATLYDLASLSKIYVLAAALRCLRAHQILLDAPLSAFLPAFPPQITLAHLLGHSSGLELHLQTLTDLPVEQWLPAIAATPSARAPVYAPGERVLYLCTNYFLLGRALVEIEGAPLKAIVEKYLLRPANLRATFAPQDLTNVAPTEAKSGETKPGEASGRGGFWCGVVHDEAARAFRAETGDCAGNAGLFTDAADVARFGQLWWSEFFHPDDVAAIGARPLPEESGARGLGFQIDKPFYMGENAPPDCWGHLGFTGPSLVLNRASKSVVVLLNNRVHPTRNGPNRMKWHRELAAWFWQN